jgi:hypothetical protein
MDRMIFFILGTTIAICIAGITIGIMTLKATVLVFMFVVGAVLIG